MSGMPLGRVQRRILTETSHGIMILNLVDDPVSSLHRAARTLERRGLVRVWRVMVPVPDKGRKIRNEYPGQKGRKNKGRKDRVTYPNPVLRKITVITAPGYHPKHVAGLATEILQREKSTKKNRRP